MPEPRMIRAPNDWEEYDGEARKWARIEMKEVVYSDLPPDAGAAIESVIDFEGCEGQDLEGVLRPDARTVELVYFDDSDESGEYDSPTRLYDSTVARIEETVQGFFGDHWRVTRKPCKGSISTHGDKHPQRLFVRRADHQRFKYRDEEDWEFLMHLHGRPDNAPEDAIRYGDLDAYPEPPQERRLYDSDIYVHEADTGTFHLVHRFREDVVSRTIPCKCGYEIEPETVVEAASIVHYAEYLHAWNEDSEAPSWLTPQPTTVFGDDLCGSCWRSVGSLSKRGLRRLHGWESLEVTVDV